MSLEDNLDSTEDHAFRDIYWRDEILQVMYWLKSEGLLEDAGDDDLRRFLQTDPGQLEERLRQSEQEGYLEASQGNAARYRLSELGIEEGRRRFVDEFAPFIGRTSHGECRDAECECHTSGEACTRP